MKISIVIPNHNGANLLSKNLPQIIQYSEGAEIIIVDDSSIDESVKMLSTHFLDKIRLIKNVTPQGFARTVNRGIRETHGEIVILLNTDVIPTKEWIKPLVNEFKSNIVFAVGCLELSHERNEIISRGRGVAKWNRGLFIHKNGSESEKMTAWVSGGSGAFRKSILDKIGLFDDIFFPFYWEDIDLSYRALKAGYELRFCKDSIVHHYHEQGAIKNQYSQNYIKRVAFRNQLVFIWINATDMLNEHLLYLPLNIITQLIHGNFYFFLGFIDALLQLSKVLKSRRKRNSLWHISDKDINLGWQ